MRSETTPERLLWGHICHIVHFESVIWEFRFLDKFLSRQNIL